ncbi:MAG: menaquinone biosynthesis decarboxylase [Chloroflexi bacterium]|nr:menaquinone biosynthesis decarboxylase [Chloroflexota bacterium]
MTFKDMREFMALLEKQGELIRIKTPVSPELEITEITDRVMKGPSAKNKALLFENVQGFSMPVAINLFGSDRRIATALGVDDLEELNHRLAKLVDFRLPQGLGPMIDRGMDFLNVLKSIGLGPTMTSRGPVQEVVEQDAPNLNTLPILKCWPGDAGKFITLMQVITRDPVSNTRNVGMYRLQVLGERKLAMHWQRHKGGAEHERKAREAVRAGLRPAPTFPAAIVLGGDPASMWCASAPLPPNIDEYLLAGWIRGKPVEFVKCVTQPIEVPADAEIVIEGYVDPNEHEIEGPFGDHTGYYTPAEPFPVFHVTAITHRKNPIYPTTIVGVPPVEDVYLGKATERLFLPLLRLFLPEVLDYHMPPAGVFHNLVIVKIRKRFPGHARKVMFGVWGLGLMMLAKAIVVVDEWVDVHNLHEVAWQTLGNVDWSKDIVVVEGPVDHLDHASYRHSFGGKIGVDATAKGPDEGYTRGWPEVVRMDEATKKKVDEMWKELGL